MGGGGGATEFDGRVGAFVLEFVGLTVGSAGGGWVDGGGGGGACTAAAAGGDGESEGDAGGGELGFTGSSSGGDGTALEAVGGGEVVVVGVVSSSEFKVIGDGAESVIYFDQDFSPCTFNLTP